MKIHDGLRSRKSSIPGTSSFRFPQRVIPRGVPYPPNGGEIPMLLALRIPLSGSMMDTVHVTWPLHVGFTLSQPCNFGRHTAWVNSWVHGAALLGVA